MDSVGWRIDPVHSSIHFGVRHLMVANVRGQFRRWNAELSLDEHDLTRSSIAVTVDAASVDTGYAERDASLRSERFFDTERFPTVTFRSRAVERVAADTYCVLGAITIRGVTKELALDARLGGFVTDLRALRRAGFTARGAINRADFGMSFNQSLEAGGVIIGGSVELSIELEAVAGGAGRHDS